MTRFLILITVAVGVANAQNCPYPPLSASGAVAQAAAAVTAATNAQAQAQAQLAPAQSAAAAAMSAAPGSAAALAAAYDQSQVIAQMNFATNARNTVGQDTANVNAWAEQIYFCPATSQDLATDTQYALNAQASANAASLAAAQAAAAAVSATQFAQDAVALAQIAVKPQSTGNYAAISAAIGAASLVSQPATCGSIPGRPSTLVSVVDSAAMNSAAAPSTSSASAPGVKRVTPSIQSFETVSSTECATYSISGVGFGAASAPSLAITQYFMYYMTLPDNKTATCLSLSAAACPGWTQAVSVANTVPVSIVSWTNNEITFETQSLLLPSENSLATETVAPAGTYWPSFGIQVTNNDDGASGVYCNSGTTGQACSTQVPPAQ